MEILEGGYELSADKTRLQLDVIHNFLSNHSYWSKKISRELVQKAMENSYCVGVYKDGRQVAYARFITDYATFGYLSDVFVLPEHRGKGLSKAIVNHILEPDWVAGLRNIMLATVDAHGLYRQFGFEPLKYPERYLLISRPDIYGDTENICR